jgi:hypothetical protein
MAVLPLARIIHVILSAAKNLAQKSRFFAALRMTQNDSVRETWSHRE